MAKKRTGKATLNLPTGRIAGMSYEETRLAYLEGKLPSGFEDAARTIARSELRKMRGRHD
jgi:hypothetical protein